MYSIVKQSSGYITVDSRVGAGTTFTVYLPRGEGQPPPARVESAISNLSGRETILVVEDESSVGCLIRKVLEARGYRILQADDFMGALEIGEAHR